MKILLCLSILALAPGEMCFAKAKPVAPKKVVEPPTVKLSPELTKLIMAEMAKVDEFDAGLGQGWQAYAATIRCYDPEGTVNENDCPYCELTKYGK